MIEALRSPEDYELFIYTLCERFPAVLGSSVTFSRRGATLARVAGELQFGHQVRLVVRERLVFDRLPVLIDSYGYEIWHGDEKLCWEKLCWYDSQPHPDWAELQSTHPHHKHRPPDIKHNRIPAPGMSFERPNLPVLIELIQERMNQAAERPQA